MLSSGQSVNESHNLGKLCFFFSKGDLQAPIVGAFEEVRLAFLGLGLDVQLLADKGCLLGDFAVQQCDPRQ